MAPPLSRLLTAHLLFVIWKAFGEAHTLNSNLFIFDSQHNNSFEQWEVEGGLDSEAVGVLKAKKWLEKYEAPAIDEGLDGALLEYIERRTREIPVSG